MYERKGKKVGQQICGRKGTQGIGWKREKEGNNRTDTWPGGSGKRIWESWNERENEIMKGVHVTQMGGGNFLQKVHHDGLG